MEKSKKISREFGEIKEGQLREQDKAAGKTKPDLYIKVTATDDILRQIKPGDVIVMEDPKEKFRRMIAKAKSSADADKLQEQMDKIPSFVKKRLVVKLSGE
jgi:hypothetical protein